ncbi:hypothetical protein HDU96_001759 [Phlyctochytrium bullatum]|nr:hypothetical protein HDU96_001759 [Phlyctochytrium bullatum]
MSNTLPHLVIFTAEEEPESDSDCSDASDDDPNRSRNTTKSRSAAQRRRAPPAASLDKPSQLLVSKLPPRTFAVHLLTEPDDVLSLLVTVVPAMLIIEHEDGAVCTVCKENVPFLPKHLREAHPISPLPPTSVASSASNKGRSKPRLDDMSLPAPKRQRQPVFALVVVRRPTDGKFLMVDEVARQGWWLPGGGVDVGEDLVKAAERETLEEAGVAINVKGILRFEYTPSPHGFRLRVIFYGEPVDPSQKPKTIPDIESAGACWVSLDQIGEHLILRGKEPTVWFTYVANGGAVWPLSSLAREKDDLKFIPDPMKALAKYQAKEANELNGAKIKSSFPDLSRP